MMIPPMVPREYGERAERERLRDTFAAAALTGLISNGDYSVESTPALAYRMADAMLAVRDSRIAKETNHNAAPAATASVESVAPQPTTRGDSARTDKAAPQPCEGTGDISEAQIDALECVVEDGRIVDMSVYGHLRSLLVKLRPEWESDRPKPVKDDVSDRSKPVAPAVTVGGVDRPVSYAETDQNRIFYGTKRDTTQPRNGALSGGPDPDSRVWETPYTPPQGSVPGEGGVPDSRTANEPVAWVAWFDFEDKPDADFLFRNKEQADCWCRKRGADSVPLYPHPAPAVTAEPVAWAALRDDGDIAWIGYTPEGAADGACGRRIVPLYLHPAPAVTAEPVAWWLRGPVAWWLRGTEYDTGCEYEFVSLVRESAEAAAKEGGTVTPLYAHPQPTLTDEEREAVERACDVIDNKTCGDSTAIRKLLERLK